MGLVLLRGQLQAQVAISQERLRSGFTDQLRQQLLHQVFAASSTQLDQLGRGITWSADGRYRPHSIRLDQAMRLLQASVTGIYMAGVLLVGQSAAWPLLLAFIATAAARWFNARVVGSWVNSTAA